MVKFNNHQRNEQPNLHFPHVEKNRGFVKRFWINIHSGVIVNHFSGLEFQGMFLGQSFQDVFFYPLHCDLIWGCANHVLLIIQLIADIRNDASTIEHVNSF